MRLSRYFVVLLVVTFIALSYAHQQFLLISANYSIKNYENRLLHLLDHNKKLMYNVTALESPANLEAKLNSTGVDYDVPVRWAVVVKEKESEPAYTLAKVAERRNAVLKSIINFMTVKAEAQALED